MKTIPVLHVSGQNNKLGKIPNVSTIPVKDCGNCDACRDDCYALKAWKQYPSTRKAWKDNSLMFRRDRDGAFEQLSQWFERKRKTPRFFRIHVAGDFLDQDHVNRWFDFARAHPATKFLAFTKMHDLNYSHAPSNLSIVLSMWAGLPIPDGGLPKAWVKPDPRIPDNAIECPGICDNCGMCWSLQDIGRDVYFDIH